MQESEEEGGRQRMDGGGGKNREGGWRLCVRMCKRVHLFVCLREREMLSTPILSI